MTTHLISIADKAKALADEAITTANDYFANHSRVETFHRDTDDSIEQLFLLIATDEVGQQHQAHLESLLNSLDTLSDRLNCGKHLRDITEVCRELFKEKCRWRGPARNHNLQFVEKLTQLKQAVDSLPDSTPGETLLVADTNTLLRSPALEKWSFDGIKNFVIVLPSTVLSEIDSFENSNKRESIRDTAAQLVRRFKGYRSHGPLHEGVKILGATISLRVVPIEPVFDELTIGLDPNSNDDRIIARLIGLIREHPKCRIALVTRDTNLQTKADYRELATLEPPTI